MTQKDDNRVIVVGAGLAGLMSAVALAEKGIHVLLLSDNPPAWAPSANSSEGMNAVITDHLRDDSFQQHLLESLACGDFLGKESLLKPMIEEASRFLFTLGQLGVPWLKDAANRYKPFSSMASQHARFYATQDITGQHMSSALVGILRRYEHDRRVEWKSGWEMLSLVRDNRGTCRGVCAIQKKSMEVRAFSAAAVVVATGGYSGLFGEKNFLGKADGSGISLVYQQGATLENVEFLQWHPFSLARNSDGLARGTLINETNWFERCFWVGRGGMSWHFFEEFFGPEWHLLRPTDLTRAMLQVTIEMGLSAGATSGGQNKEDIGIHGMPFLAEKNRTISANARRKVDLPAEDSLILQPTIMMSLGGLDIDPLHMTSLPGVFAAGEAVSGYHGACGLSGNGLLSALVSGKKAAEGISIYLAHQQGMAPVEESTLTEEMRLQHSVNNAILDLSGPENIHVLSEELRFTLYNIGFFARHEDDLQKTANKIEEIKLRFQKLTLADRGHYFNRELLLARRLYNAVELSQAFVASAINRRETRGCHERSDFPQRDDVRFLKNSKAHYAATGPIISYEDVVLPTVIQETAPVSTPEERRLRVMK